MGGTVTCYALIQDSQLGEGALGVIGQCEPIPLTPVIEAHISLIDCHTGDARLLARKGDC